MAEMQQDPNSHEYNPRKDGNAGLSPAIMAEREPSETEMLREEVRSLREQVESLTDFSDAVSSLSLCHSCQPRLERAFNSVDER